MLIMMASYTRLNKKSAINTYRSTLKIILIRQMKIFEYFGSILYELEKLKSETDNSLVLKISIKIM